MKKVLFLAALVLMSAGSFAQKKNVATARNRALAEDNPDFVGAREAINEALENEETKNLPNTYYVAGLIGFQENVSMRNASYLGQKVDPAKKAAVLNEAYGYWMKAMQLAKEPIGYDKKGKPQFDKTTVRDITNKMAEWFTNADFYFVGLDAYNAGDYKGAYDAFIKHVNMPELPQIKENAKALSQMLVDSTFYQIKYYTGVAAVQAEMHPEAIAVFESLKDKEVEPIRTYLNLYNEYVIMKDTAKYVALLEEGMNKFPEEIAFLQYLINHYIYSNQMEQAIAYLQQAINREPNNAQYLWIMGNLKANENKFDEAVEMYQRAIAADSNMADAHAGIGRVYCNQARVLSEQSENMSGADLQNLYKQMDELYHKALPYFEKALELNGEERDYQRVLYMLYDRFNMSDKLQKISALLGY